MGRYREIQTFDAVAMTGSLAGAARHLQVSCATVMRTISALETRLNNTLLLRGPRGVTLSPAGKEFAHSCRHILRQTVAAEHSAVGLHARPSGQLTVALPLQMASQIFMPVALAYLEAFADVRLLTLTREAVPKLLEEGIDIALVVSQLPDSSGFAMPIGKVKPIICGAPGYLAKWGKPQTPVDLKNHRTIVTTAQGCESEWRFCNAGSYRQAKLAPVLRCTTQRAAIRAASLGLGLVRCMSYEVHDEVRNGLLIPVLTDFSSPAVPAQLLYRNGRRADARVRTFIDFATPLLRAHPALLESS